VQDAARLLARAGKGRVAVAPPDTVPVK